MSITTDERVGLPELRAESHVIYPTVRQPARWVTIRSEHERLITGNYPTLEIPQWDREQWTEAEQQHLHERGSHIDYSGTQFQAMGDMLHGIVPFLIGPAGTGKTSIGQEIAGWTGQPLIRTSWTDTSDPDDLGGQWGLLPNEHGGTPSNAFIWQTVAISYGREYLVILDEWTQPPAEVQVAFRSALDSNQLVINNHPAAPAVQRNPYNYMYATSNEWWTGDNSNVVAPPEADQDRMSVLLVGYPPINIEFDIVRSKTPDTVPDEAIHCAQATWRKVRQLKQDGEVDTTASTRSLLRFCTMLTYCSPATAIRKTFDRQDAEAAAKCAAQVEAYDWTVSPSEILQGCGEPRNVHSISVVSTDDSDTVLARKQDDELPGKAIVDSSLPDEPVHVADIQQDAADMQADEDSEQDSEPVRCTTCFMWRGGDETPQCICS